MKYFDTLYARNSNGKINEWSVRVENIVSSNVSNIVVSEGLIDGQKTETNRIAKPKNVGKMNQTSSYEQACSEAQSRWEKKKKQGYKSLIDLGILKEHETSEDYYYNGGYFLSQELDMFIEQALPKDRTDANNISKPMKAQPYFKDNGDVRISFPCFGQPKLNGFRVMARWEKVMEGEGIFAQEVEKVVFRSKEGLRYTVLEHIEDDFEEDMFILDDKGDKVAYDGEMYIHNEILSEISSAVRKRNSKTSLLVFHIFDIACNSLTQKDRITLLSNLERRIRVRNKHSINIVQTCQVLNNVDAQELTDEYIKRGYEGAIFRDMKATYQFGKRPQTMVKLKRSKDKEFLIKDVVGGDNSPDLGVFVCIAENGKEFKCTPEGNHDLKREYLSNKHKYIGKPLTVRFFEYTKDGLPFHAVGIDIRDYE